MNYSYREIFPNKHTFLAVIHVEDLEQAVTNSVIAIENGADGVFLIDHGDGRNILPMYNTVRSYTAAKLDTGDLRIWMGYNILGIPLRHVSSEIHEQVSGFWTDESGINENDDEPDYGARMTKMLCKGRGVKGLWFGGIEFKHQPPIQNLPRVAQLATKHMDVIVTSGERTGSAPKVEKLATIREAIGAHPLANASGTTPENVHLMKPYVDCFLVATGISKSFTELDPARVRAMTDAIKS